MAAFFSNGIVSGFSNRFDASQWPPFQDEIQRKFDIVRSEIRSDLPFDQRNDPFTVLDRQTSSSTSSVANRRAKCS